MKRISPFLIVVLINFVAVEGGWTQSQKYNYKVIIKAQTSSYNEKWLDDDASYARLSIRAVNDEILIGEFSRAEYANTEKIDYPYPLDTPFKMELKNGVFGVIYIDRDLIIPQIFQLKFIMNIIMNQFRVDTNSIKFEMGVDSASFSKNESTAVGQCETTYEISPMSEDLARSRPDLVPLPELRGAGIFLDANKTINYDDCNKRVNLTRNPLSSTSLSEITRTIMSGPIDNLTVQSSVTDIKSADIINTKPYNIGTVNLTLESIDTNSEYPPLQDDRFVHIDSRLKFNKLSGALTIEQLFVENDDRRWSGCFNRVASADSICHSAFGAEWEAVIVQNCGFLDSGRTALCEHKYPGCESTACFSVFMQNLCDERLPVHKGGFADCAPGLWRWRCCPN